MPGHSESPVGESVARYQLLERIAVGGMAEVYRAVVGQQVGGDRCVVVKRMLPRIATERSARAMFAEEAQLGARIRHPNVVQVIDFGEAEEHPYLVLEFVKGCDLWRLTRHLTRVGQTLSIDQALYVAREMLAGLQAVHEATDEHGNRLGVVHQDVSPSNVLLSVHGEIKLGDLGIARSRLREKFRSVSERAKGKLGYLAPEQVRGESWDRRADIFSAGVVTAELLMGRPLFSGGSELAVLLAIRDSLVHPFLEFARDLPEGLRDAVVEALSPKPARRPASAELLSSRLLPFQTEPTDQLRSSVAKLVAEALEGGASALPLTLTPTRAFAPGALLHAADDKATPLVHLPVDADVEGDRTPAIFGGEYTVHTGAAPVGPWSLAETVQAVSTGRVGAQDPVSVDGRAPVPLAQLPELARHLPGSTNTTSRALLTDPAGPPEEPSHPLATAGLIKILGQAALDRTTALMLCELGGVRKEVYLQDGAPAFVSSNLAGELLGEHLVATRVISRGELDMALAVMPRFEGRLGDTLSALGLVEPVLLFRHIAEQVREKLLDLFTWQSGSCTIYPGVPPPPSGFPLNIDAWDVLDEGLSRRIREDLDATLVEQLRASALVPATGPRLVAMRASLPLRLKQLLGALDRPMRLDELCRARENEQPPAQTVRDAILLSYLEAIRFANELVPRSP